MSFEFLWASLVCWRIALTSSGIATLHPSQPYSNLVRLGLWQCLDDSCNECAEWATACFYVSIQRRGSVRASLTAPLGLSLIIFYFKKWVFNCSNDWEEVLLRHWASLESYVKYLGGVLNWSNTSQDPKSPKTGFTRLATRSRSRVQASYRDWFQPLDTDTIFSRQIIN